MADLIRGHGRFRHAIGVWRCLIESMPILERKRLNKCINKYAVLLVFIDIAMYKGGLAFSLQRI